MDGGERFNYDVVHSPSLHENLKIYTTWYLFAILVRWDGTT